MVRVTEYNLRENNEGKSFFALTLQGGVEIVRSASGNSYATVKKASLPTTFDETTCKSLVGMELPGSIQKVECEPYYYVVKETGEELMLNHRYEFSEHEEDILQDLNKTLAASNSDLAEEAK